ncbi:winged helix-turn-helix domain-containing protein [Cryobacterium roopkundense]|uniref:Restriction system protein n=2 Tax=Cryobacterium roopkundense TaxID=1001240 RepID=A0A7W8ZVY6_9MICO|nr:winged helix-turn-helix domain-containing protein [Cryobacterium roopkundense]MBB5640995.1 restriction system protein [Cryobacterium roopkundense]
MIPTLHVLSDGVVRHWREFQPLVADQAALTDEQRQEMLPSGNQIKYENRIGWGVSFLTNVGALTRPKRGHYGTTDAGRQLLSRFPNGVKESDIRMLGKDPQSPIRIYQKSERSTITVDPIAVSDTETMTPTEQVQSGVERIHEEVAVELLERLQVSPVALFDDGGVIVSDDGRV